MSVTPSRVLIVTNEGDAHADAVITSIGKHGVVPIRLNTESFATKTNYRYVWDDIGNLIHGDIHFLDSEKVAGNIGVIWWRKPDHFILHPEVTDPWAVKYSQTENRAVIESLQGMYPGAKWVNDFFKMKAAASRINQIPVAKKIGLKIPPTILTNDIDSAIEFIKYNDDCIIKPMDFSGFLHENAEYGCFTRPIDIDTLEKYRKNFSLAPVFIQKRVFKKAEYRVTIIGHKVFSCKIGLESSDDTDIALDWRVTDPDALIHSATTLPFSITDGLKRMLQHFGLKFGAFDIIEDQNGEYNFIELNPNGQWYWIEEFTNQPMCEAMVDLICDLARPSNGE